MALWVEWFRCVSLLRPACARRATFLWMSLALAGLSIRSELAGVTSFVRALWLKPLTYRRLLHLFHSPALDLAKLSSLWIRLALGLFRPVTLDGRVVFLADGLKAPKEGRKMPAVKKLHQESSDNSKPPFIFGHSFQAVALLAKGPLGQPFAVPLASRIHEGLVFSNRDQRTLLDKLVALFLEIVGVSQVSAILVADAYYASKKVILPLLVEGHHLSLEPASTPPAGGHLQGRRSGAGGAPGSTARSSTCATSSARRGASSRPRARSTAKRESSSPIVAWTSCGVRSDVSCASSWSITPSAGASSSCVATSRSSRSR